MVLAPTLSLGADLTERIFMSTMEQKRNYEVVVLMHPDASVEEQKELFRKNKGIVEQFGGTIYSLDTWGKRSLANHIGKTRKAVYFHSTFEAKPAVISELERTMRINDKVLRYMHTRIDERDTLAKYMETFKRAIVESATKEKEREAKIQAKRAAAASMSSDGPSRK
jgi:small subunit ribosomal protein S6